MKTPFLILAFGFMALSVYASESATNLATQFSVKPRREQKMENLPVGREQEIIEAFVKLGDVDVLLRLNHSLTVERVMGEFTKLKGMDSYLRRCIESSASPYIIDELTPALYKDDRITVRYYGEHADMDYGESAQAAEIIGQLIIRAPEFPPEVKEWAKKHLGGPGPDIIQAGRAWWELNQAALLANQFDKVQVPMSYPAGLMPEEPAQQLAAPPTPIEPTREPTAADASATEPTPEPVKSSVVASIPTSAAEPAPATKTNAVWWIVGLIILAGGVVFVSRKKKRRT